MLRIFSKVLQAVGEFFAFFFYPFEVGGFRAGVEFRRVGGRVPPSPCQGMFRRLLAKISIFTFPFFGLVGFSVFFCGSGHSKIREM